MRERDLRDWKALCEYLAEQPGRSAAKSEIPKHLNYLLSSKLSKKRFKVGVVFYSPGWGWRLKKDWLQRLNGMAQQEKSVSESR